MSGRRRGRLAALAASAGLAGALVLGISQVRAGPACGPDPLPPCDTTTTEQTTTTLLITTTIPETTTTFDETTTTRGRTATTAEVVHTTTSTSLEVATSLNVLVPGDGTEGAESTTTTETPTTIASSDTSDAALLGLIIGGLVLTAVVVGILTWRYWVATRPPLAPAVGSDHG